MNLGDILKNNSEAYPNRMGLADSKRKFTWREVNSRVNSLANALLGLGLQKGDRITILSENCPEFVEFFFAAAKSGVIGTTINYRLLPEQVARLVNDCEPKAIIVQDQFVPLANSSKGKFEKVPLFIGLGEKHGYPYDYEVLVSRYPSCEPDVEISPDDVCHLVYTSGTTGWVKGGMITHRARIAHAYQFGIKGLFEPDDIYSQIASLAFAGCQFALMGVVCAGITIIAEPFTPESWLDTIKREKVTTPGMTVIRYKTIRDYARKTGLKYDFSSIRSLLMGGGENASPQMLREIAAFFGVSEVTKVYAGTEFGNVLMLSAHDSAAGLRAGATEKKVARLSSVGRTPLFAWIRLVDENDNDVATGEIGEVIVRSESLMKGYWNKPELTREALRNGWYHTKDLMRKDDDGYFYFVGRKDNMIKTGMINVFAEEVENVIARHAGVKEVAVFGIEDERWGEAVTAALSLKEGHELNEQDIKDYCRKHLSGYQIPKAVHFLPELPKQASGYKIWTAKLREMYGRKPT